MLKTFRDNKFFLIPYVITLLISIIFLIIFSKDEIHIAINQNHHRVFDILFQYITHLGDGLFIVLLAIVFLFYRFRYAILIAISGIFSGIIAQIFKVTLTGMARPVKHFEGIYDLYLVPGIDLHSWSSYPSGHSVIAFSLFLALALISKNNLLKLIFFFIAILVGFSRVYISQHFLIDIVAGSFIGAAVSLLCFYFISKIRKKWIDKSIIG